MSLRAGAESGAFLGEIDRAEQLGIRYLVAHPGAHLDDTEAAGLARVAAALDGTAVTPGYRTAGGAGPTDAPPRTPLRRAAP